MLEPKYIIFNKVYPVVFHAGIQHCDVMIKLQFRKSEITSAGFVYQDLEGKFHCHGGSTSLNIMSQPEIDSEIINRMFNQDASETQLF